MTVFDVDVNMLEVEMIKNKEIVVCYFCIQKHKAFIEVLMCHVLQTLSVLFPQFSKKTILNSMYQLV